jgi:hypothetical protein
LNPHLELLLSSVYAGALAPEHHADLAKSGLTEDTIHRHRLMSVPPSMIGPLLGFDMPGIRSAMLIPFPDPAGGWWMDYVRVKVFPSLTDPAGHTVKYLQRKGAPPCVFFPLLTLDQVVASHQPLLIAEGEKKSLAVAQLGRAVIGIQGVEGWHISGSRTSCRSSM